MTSACVQLYANPQIPGEFLLQPLKSFSRYMGEKTERVEGWKKVAWAISHIVLGIFAYPFFGLLASVGLGIKFVVSRCRHVEEERRLNSSSTPLSLAPVLTAPLQGSFELRAPRPSSEEGALRANEIKQQLEEMQAGPVFCPYELVIEFPLRREKTYSIHNQADETRVIQELEEWMQEHFQSVIIKRGISSEDICQILQRQYARVRNVFASRFRLFQSDRFGEGERLGLKPVAEEGLNEHTKRIRYANGIEEVLYHSQGKWQVQERYYPQGKYEKGSFDSNGTLLSGVRFAQGEYRFFHPERIGNAEIIAHGRLYQFGFVDIEGKRQLVLLEKEGSSYRISEQPPLPILFDQTMPTSFLIQEVIECPISSISPKEIVQYAFEVGERGEIRLFSLREKDVLAILKQAQKLQIPFDLHAVSPKTNQTLFSKWAVEGSTELVQWMLEMDPTCIDQTKNQPVSFLRQVLHCWTGEKRGELLRAAMQARGIPLSDKDLWVDRIHAGDASFENREFLALEPAFQKELYMTAHAWGHAELIDRMNRLGMKQRPVCPKGPTPLSINMDLLEQRKAVESCLLQLRAERRILLPQEAPSDLRTFHPNYNDFSRVLGARFVKETVKRLSLKHIDAAETFALLKPDTDSLRFHTEHGTFIQSTDMDIYAEKIVEVQRWISLEEADELLDVIEATGFADIHRGNFMITEDKIYFVDLEWANFQEHAAYHLMGRLSSFVKPEEREALLTHIQRRIEAHQKKQKEEASRLKQKQEFEEESRALFFCGRGLFEVPIASILR